MNLILLFQSDFIGDTNLVRLNGRRHVHVRDVLRAKAGDSLCVGLAGGNIGEGTIMLLDEESVEMEVKLDSHPPRPSKITLVLALPRPKVMRRVVSSVTSLGVKRIFMINAGRVEKSYWKSPFLDKYEFDKRIITGLEQARDTIFPDIHLRPLFKPFVEDELPGLIEGSLPLVAHPASRDTCPCDVMQPVTLAVGPEGGFIPYEIEKLAACGFRPVSMGDRILTVETAIPALLSRLAAL
ncbi:MAG: 16S rRNA (uracil(1498)-N(3))-methyltransferase [Nitrospirae bacterium]|nr:16S rRNA (uracil(1498)-N(3))-methyltransferase [Nitrospirota bacterium]